MFQQSSRWIRRFLAAINGDISVLQGQVALLQNDVNQLGTDVGYLRVAIPTSGTGVFAANNATPIHVWRPTSPAYLSPLENPAVYIGNQITSAGVVTAHYESDGLPVTAAVELQGLPGASLVSMAPLATPQPLSSGLVLVITSTNPADTGGVICGLALLQLGN